MMRDSFSLLRGITLTESLHILPENCTRAAGGCLALSLQRHSSDYRVQTLHRHYGESGL